MTQHTVEMPMIQLVVDESFERGEVMIVPDESDLVKIVRLELHFNYIVVTVKPAGADIDTNVVPAGVASVTVRFVAASGPALVRVIV